MIGSIIHRFYARTFMVTILIGCVDPAHDVQLPTHIEEARSPTCEEQLSISRVITSWPDRWGWSFQTREPLADVVVACVSDVRFAVVTRSRFQAICGVQWASGTRERFLGARACPVGERCFRACYVPDGDSAVLVFCQDHRFDWRRQSIRHEVIHRVLRCMGESDDHSSEAFARGSGAASVEVRSGDAQVGVCL